MENNKKMFGLKIFFLSMCLYMIYLVFDTSTKSNLAEAIPVLNQYPWFVTTIVDFYFNIAIISAWTIYKEASFVKSLFWIVLFICLGSIATAFYVFLQLKKSDSFEDALLRKA